jgi:hypothetical protein
MCLCKATRACSSNLLTRRMMLSASLLHVHDIMVVHCLVVLLATVHIRNRPYLHQVRKNGNSHMKSYNIHTFDMLDSCWTRRQMQLHRPIHPPGSTMCTCKRTSHLASCTQCGYRDTTMGKTSGIASCASFTWQPHASGAAGRRTPVMIFDVCLNGHVLFCRLKDAQRQLQQCVGSTAGASGLRLVAWRRVHY